MFWILQKMPGGTGLTGATAFKHDGFRFAKTGNPELFEEVYGQEGDISRHFGLFIAIQINPMLKNGIMLTLVMEDF